VLAADEHPGAFLEDELPFAPRAVEPPPRPTPPGQDPWSWFQRWRVPITALFVVLIALAVALAFGAKPDEPPARAPLGSGPIGPVSTGAPAGDATSSTPAPGSTPATAVAPPLASNPGSPETAPAGPDGASTASTIATGPATTAPGTRPIATAASSTSTAAPTSAPIAGPSSSQPATTRRSTSQPATSQPATTRATSTTRPTSSTRPPATATTVPGYATGSTQARGPNDPPFIANPGLVATTADEAVQYQIGVSARPGEVLAFRATGLPRGLAIDSATGLVTGTSPGPETTGVQVTVTSSTGSSFTQGFTWVVNR